MSAILAANFPISVWDGLTNQKALKQDLVEPDSAGYNRLITEILAIQNYLLGGEGASIVDANAFVIGPNGLTNPTFQIDTVTASAATGVKIKSAAAGSGIAIVAISSGTNENFTIDAKGTGLLILGSVSTGGVRLDNKVGFYGTAPIAQQTSVAVTEIAIHAALVALGLITA